MTESKGLSPGAPGAVAVGAAPPAPQPGAPAFQQSWGYHENDALGVYW